MNSIFPYIGGKHLVADRLIKLLPKHNCFVELFAGAANVLFAKPRSKVEVINDVNGTLVSIFRCLRWHPDEFVKELAFILHSRQEFNDFHDQPGLTEIQRAARYWFKLKTTFSGTGPSGKRSFQGGPSQRANLKYGAYEVIYQAHDRLEGVYIENGDFEKVITRYDRPDTVFFCDPPYWKGADYGVPFTWEDQERLATTLRGIEGKFLLTINDHADIRPLYKGFHTRKLPMAYTARLMKTKKRKMVNELIIANYPLPRRR